MTKGAPASDIAFSWADRASQRGVAVAYAGNAVLTALAWSATTSFYDHRILLPSVAAIGLSTGWFIAQTLRNRFRRRDLRVVLGVLLFVLLATALAPTVGSPPSGWSWTQSWTIATVCGAVLLLPQRQAVPSVIVITGLQWWIRLAFVPPGIAFVEAVIPIVGGLITARAARYASEKFDRVGAALALAARTESQLLETDARGAAQDWWNRLLHDKVLGALLLTSRATSPTLLSQARQVAEEALATLERVQRAAQGSTSTESGESQSAGGEGGDPAPSFEEALTGLAIAHGLLVDVHVRGRDDQAPSRVLKAVLAAADQALRNVAQHSGQRAVWIRAHQSRTRVDVQIVDHGHGFDPEQVEHRRLGLRHSIPGHMALVDGTAKVSSRPERGTSVALKWSLPDPDERGAPLTQSQLRSLWWVGGTFTGLHLLGGILAGSPLVVGTPGWLGFGLLILAYVLLHSLAKGPVLVWAQILVLTSCALMLWHAPLSVADGWRVWFLGACHAALVIPALRGRPMVSIASGWCLFAIIVVTFVVRAPERWSDAGQLALPFVVIPSVAALYAVMLARADRRLRGAQESEAEARRRLVAAEARQRVVAARITSLAPGTIALLERLVAGDLILAADRSAAKLMEAANRDHLVAADVLDPVVMEGLSAARTRGVVVHLTSLADADGVDRVEGAARAGAGSGSGADWDMPSAPARLAEFRDALLRLTTVAAPGDEVTARWQPGNSYAAGTLTITSERVEGEAFETIAPIRAGATPTDTLVAASP